MLNCNTKALNIPCFGRPSRPVLSNRNKGTNIPQMKKASFNIPEWALPALINGDFSGLSDSDSAEIIKFTTQLEKEYGPGSITVDTEKDDDYLGFKWSNDINSLGANCYRGYYLFK